MAGAEVLSTRWWWETWDPLIEDLRFRKRWYLLQQHCSSTTKPPVLRGALHPPVPQLLLRDLWCLELRPCFQLQDGLTRLGCEPQS